MTCYNILRGSIEGVPITHFHKLLLSRAKLSTRQEFKTVQLEEHESSKGALR